MISRIAENMFSQWTQSLYKRPKTSFWNALHTFNHNNETHDKPKDTTT